MDWKRDLTPKNKNKKNTTCQEKSYHYLKKSSPANPKQKHQDQLDPHY